MKKWGIHKLIKAVCERIGDSKYYFLMLIALFAGFVVIELIGSYSVLLDEKMFLAGSAKRLIKPIIFIPLASSLILSFIVITTSKKFTIPIIVLALFSLFAWANLLHARVFSTIIPLSMYTNTQNIRGLWGSIIGLFEIHHILYLIIPLIVLIIYRRIKSKIEVVSFRKRLLIAITMFCIPIVLMMGYMSLSIWMNDLRSSSITGPLLIYNKILPQKFYCEHGCVASFIVEILECNISGEYVCCKEDKVKIESYLSSVPPLLEPTEENISPVKKNLIIILVESLNSKALTASIGEQYIMPNIAGLMKDSQTLVALRVRQPEQGGMSIAGQFNILTGLIATYKGVFSCDYPWNTYPSIIKAMKSKYRNLSSTTLVPTNRHFWRQNCVDASLGVDSLFGKDEIGSGEELKSDDWLSDLRMFQFAMTKLEQKKDTPFYMLVVTADMHTPYIKIPECELVFPENYPAALKAYYSRAYNDDKYIGRFIDSLKKLDGGRVYEESLIVLCADHNVPMEFMDGISVNEDRNNNQSLSCYIPMLFVNTGYDMSETNKEVEKYEYVQEQAYPTMLSILNLPDEKYTGLFPSILDLGNCKQWDFSDVSRSTSNSKLKDAFDVSELIIKSNYLK